MRSASRNLDNIFQPPTESLLIDIKRNLFSLDINNGGIEMWRDKEKKHVKISKIPNISKNINSGGSGNVARSNLTVFALACYWNRLKKKNLLPFSLQYFFPTKLGSCFSAYHTNWKPKLNDRLQSLLPRNVLLNIMDIISFSVAAAPSGRQTTICDELSDGISESSRGESSTLYLVLLWALRGLKI